jgi:hypothetical protein
MAALAIALAVLLVAVLVASRVALRPQATLVPGGTGGVAQAALDSFPCSLAVIQISDAANPGQGSSTSTNLGFVNIPSGEFWVDPRATVRDLPGGATVGPWFYSASLKRWLPATVRTISPDGRAYAYVRMLPQGATTSSQYTSSELHVFDVEKRVDRNLWTQSQSI